MSEDNDVILGPNKCELLDVYDNVAQTTCRVYPNERRISIELAEATREGSVVLRLIDMRNPNSGDRSKPITIKIWDQNK